MTRPHTVDAGGAPTTTARGVAISGQGLWWRKEDWFSIEADRSKISLGTAPGPLLTQDPYPKRRRVIDLT